MSTDNENLNIKSKILNMKYDRKNNLFELTIKNLEDGKVAGIAIAGTDWGITKEVPDEIIDKFCNDMIGQEKNIHLQIEKTSIPKGMGSSDSFVSEEDLYKVHDDIDKYPIAELDRHIREENEN